MFIGIGFGIFWSQWQDGGSAPAVAQLDFSDPANSMYIPLLFGYQVV